MSAACSDPEDLGLTFRRNPDLVSTLFDEDYRISLGAPYAAYRKHSTKNASVAIPG
jgi:hypothetical protein